MHCSSNILDCYVHNVPSKNNYRDNLYYGRSIYRHMLPTLLRSLSAGDSEGSQGCKVLQLGYLQVLSPSN